MNPVYIIESIRTPRAKAKESGGLHDLNPFELLDSLYSHFSEYEILDSKELEEVILGCVTQQGEQAGNIAKSSSLYSGFPRIDKIITSFILTAFFYFPGLIHALSDIDCKGDKC